MWVGFGGSVKVDISSGDLLIFNWSMVFGFLATLSWFFAFTLIQASFVRAVGQIEIFFSYISSKYLFKEKITFIEIVGILIFITGATLLLLTK